MDDLFSSSDNLVKQLRKISPEYIGKERFERLLRIFNKFSLRAKDDNITGGQFQMVCGPLAGRIEDFFDHIDCELNKAEEEKKRIAEHEVEVTSKRKSRKRKLYSLNSLNTQVPDPLPVGISLNRTPFFFIERSHDVINLGKVLKQVEVFAFDLERTVAFRHGSTNKVCLLQISTQNEDFVIDTLAYGMRSAVANYLRPAFEDPQIIKIVHGHDDAKWLRTVFDIHIKNQFDTSTNGHSLQQLVYIACGVKLEKEYQTADWMLRLVFLIALFFFSPLSRAMVDYARLDTHYLISCWEFLARTSGRSLANHLQI
ncbi:hypothetical protein ACQ4LE_002507 [Meloidogyne hapla]